jgi:hypothetical protein
MRYFWIFLCFATKDCPDKREYLYLQKIDLIIKAQSEHPHALIIKATPQRSVRTFHAAYGGLNIPSDLPDVLFVRLI